MEASTPLFAQFDAFTLDEANARITRDGQPLDLPPRAFSVLCTLARHGGRLVPKDALLDAVWGHQHVSESVLKTTISQVRAVLRDDPKTPRYIETAPRRGYRFIAALATPGAALRPAVPAAPATRPSASSAPAAATLIAREAALALLDTHLAQMGQGRCQVVFVAGEPGIGKTSLIESFAARAGCLNVLGQCIEQYGAGEAYLPVLEALNAMCRGPEGASLLAAMRVVAPTWLVQLPWYLTDADRSQLQREVGGATQQRMLREMGELLDRQCATVPLLMVLEDLHWADEATVQLVGYLARRRSPARLMLLASFRPAEIVAGEHPLKGLRQELRLHGQCREIDLEAFSERDVADYLTSRTGGHVFDDAFVRQLHRHTDGLPLFVVNLVDALIADGVIEPKDGGWEVKALPRLAVPRNIVGVIEKQIERLPERTRHWLGVASVAGAEFADTAVADALEEDPQPVREAFEDLARQQHWLRAVDWVPLGDGRRAVRFAFRHALYRRVFYQSIGEARRSHWHLRLGQVLEQLHGASAPDAAAELAMHFERAQELPRAVGYLQIGAAKALSRFAPAEGVALARRGLALLERLPPGESALSAELELRVLEGVSLVQQTYFSSPDVAAIFDRAQQLCDMLPGNPARARAMHGLWWVKFGRGELAQAKRLAERILQMGEASGDASLRVAGAGSLGMTLTHLGEFRAAREKLLEALAAYDQAGTSLMTQLFVQDPGVEAMSYLAMLDWWMGRPREAWGYVQRAVEVAERSRHRPTLAIALHITSVVYCATRQFQQVIDVTHRINELVEGHWLAGGPSAHGWIYGRALVGLGRVEEGLEHMRRAKAICEQTGLAIGRPAFYQMYADACRTVGRIDEALACIEEGIAFGESSEEVCLVAPSRRVRGELLLLKGDTAAARAELEQAIAIARESGNLQHELDALVVWARLPGLDPVKLRGALEDALARYGEEEGPAANEARAILAAS